MLCWSLPTVECTEVIQIILEVWTFTYLWFIQLLQHLLRQLSSVCQQAVDCRRLWKVKQFIWYTSRTTCTCAGSDPVSVPLMSNTIQVILNVLFRIRLNCPTVSQILKQLYPPLAAISAKKDHQASIRWLPGDVPYTCTDVSSVAEHWIAASSHGVVFSVTVSSDTPWISADLLHSAHCPRSISLLDRPLLDWLLAAAFSQMILRE